MYSNIDETIQFRKNIERLEDETVQEKSNFQIFLSLPEQRGIRSMRIGFECFTYVKPRLIVTCGYLVEVPANVKRYTCILNYHETEHRCRDRSRSLAKTPNSATSES